jgi:hypothetical protein
VPLPPPTITAPYPMLETSLNLARTRLNDAIANISGDILTDVQPFTATMVNAAWRNLQIFLCNLGYSKYKRKFWAYAMPVVGSQDPSSETFWSWTQFFDGSGYFVPPTVTVLPQDLIAPLVVKERMTGSNQPFRQIPSAPDGLPEGPKRPWNGVFEWKNDAIYMPGSTFSMDYEVEYAAFDADFATYTPLGGDGPILGNPNTTPVLTPLNMPIPIMRSESAMANYIAAECALGRDDVDAQPFLDKAEKDAKLLMNNSDIKLKQRRPVQRKAYSGRGSRRGQLWGSQGY